MSGFVIPPMTSTSQAIVPSEYANASLGGCHDYTLPALFELCPQLGPNTRVLDVGCGNGSVAAEVIKRGCKIVGIDMSETGIRMARQKCPEGRFEVLPADQNLLRNLGEEPFDVVYSLEVIEHLYDPLSFVAGCFSATRPGGKFICSTPYHGYLKNLTLSLLDKWDRHLVATEVGEHIKFFSRRTLSQLLEKTGFRHLEFRGGGRAPYLWKSMVMSGQRP
jgi:2-polyprenyl-3-methyl-5-hydroxy-6-metoxy-1,4-benzoquinol methylase